MAGITQRYTTAITDDAGRVVATQANIQTGDAEETFSVTAAGEGNVTVPLTVDISACIAFWVVSDQAVAMAVNDDGSPNLEVNLAADVPYWWVTGTTCPITEDVTGIKFTNAGTTDATVSGGFLTT